MIKTPLLYRIMLFVLLFVLISGVTGSWLIAQKKLLFPFHFGIYGSAGKVILFSIISFLLLTKDRILGIALDRPTWRNFLWGASIVVNVGLFFFFAPGLIGSSQFSDAPVLSLLTHATLWGAGMSIVLAVFGWKYMFQVWDRFRKELVISLSLAIGFYFSFQYIFKLWPYLSGVVLVAVSNMLMLTGFQVQIIRPLTLLVPGFAVTIGEYCSGIESMFLISVLYIMIGCIEWQKLRFKRYFLLFPLLLIGMFGLNIIRVYGIILAGVWISPEIAAKLFHTYLGMILFMVYFVIFLTWAYPSLLQPKPGKEQI